MIIKTMPMNPDTAVSITVTVAAKAAAKAAEQKNNEDDNENKSYRHKLISPSERVPWLLRGVNDRDAHSWRWAGYLDLGFELLCECLDDGGAQTGMSAAAALLPQSSAVVGHR